MSRSRNLIVYLNEIFQKNRINFSLIYGVNLLGAASQIYLWKIKEPTIPEFLVSVMVVFTILHFTLYYLYKHIVLPIVNNTGLDDDEVSLINFQSLSDNNITIDANNRHHIRWSVFEFPDSISNKYSFPNSSHTIKLISDINYLAFLDSKWINVEDSQIKSIQKKYNRNYKHFLRNKYTIMCIANGNDEFIGFSHILPVNKPVWDLYIAGKVNDLDFPAEFILSDYEKPYGYIVFTLATLTKCKHLLLYDDLMNNISEEVKSSLRSLKGNYGKYIGTAVIFQMNYFLKKHHKGGEVVPVLIQTEVESIGKLLKSINLYPIGKNLSADNIPVYYGLISIAK